MEKIIDYFDWFDVFKPQDNVIIKDAPYSGKMYETFGEEYEQVRKIQREDPYKIWTVFDNGDIMQGLSIINRLGYFICEVSWAEGMPNYVPDDEEY